MGKDDGYKIRNPEGVYFITFAVIEWVDVFSRSTYTNLLLDSIRYCQMEKGLIVHAWCVMTNHVHFILSSRQHNLSDILRDFKKFTSKKIIQAIADSNEESRKAWMLRIFRNRGNSNSRNSTYQFWQQDNHPVELFSNGFIEQKLDYIHNNPVAACVVSQPEHYLYSSARDYAGESGLLKIELID